MSPTQPSALLSLTPNTTTPTTPSLSISLPLHTIGSYFPPSLPSNIFPGALRVFRGAGLDLKLCLSAKDSRDSGSSGPLVLCYASVDQNSATTAKASSHITLHNGSCDVYPVLGGVKFSELNHTPIITLGPLQDVSSLVPSPASPVSSFSSSSTFAPETNSTTASSSSPYKFNFLLPPSAIFTSPLTPPAGPSHTPATFQWQPFFPSSACAHNISSYKMRLVRLDTQETVAVYTPSPFSLFKLKGTFKFVIDEMRREEYGNEFQLSVVLSFLGILEGDRRKRRIARGGTAQSLPKPEIQAIDVSVPAEKTKKIAEVKAVMEIMEKSVVTGLKQNDRPIVMVRNYSLKRVAGYLRLSIKRKLTA